MDNKTDHLPRSSPNKRTRQGNLWHTSLEIQARLFREYSDCMLSQIAKNQALIAEQMEKMSARTEHVTSLMAHAAVRAVAIAAQARREDRDRRVLTLPLPQDRRSGAREDRRISPFGNGKVIAMPTRSS
jgi:hypothetical protein